MSQLEKLPNIGKSIAGSLRLIGIDHPRKLIGKEPFALYDTLCKAFGNRQDPCVIDVLISAIHFMEGGDPLPWWSFTDERKRRMSKRSYRSKGRNLSNKGENDDYQKIE